MRFGWMVGILIPALLHDLIALSGTSSTYAIRLSRCPGLQPQKGRALGFDTRFEVPHRRLHKRLPLPKQRQSAHRRLRAGTQKCTEVLRVLPLARETTPSKRLSSNLIEFTSNRIRTSRCFYV